MWLWLWYLAWSHTPWCCTCLPYRTTNSMHLVTASSICHAFTAVTGKTKQHLTPPHPTGACLVNIQDNQHGLHSLPLSQSVTQHLPSYVRAGTYSTLLSCSIIVIISNFSSQIILLYCLWLLYWSGNDTITSFFSTLPHLLLAVFPSPFSSWGFLVCFVFPASIHAKFLSFTTEWSILSLFFC